jgi:hypothetical protein
MESLHRDQLMGDTGELPERGMHHAHGPEVIDERGIGAILAIAVADDAPGLLAMQKISFRQAAAGHQVTNEFAECSAGASRCVVAQESLVKAVGTGEGIGAAATGFRLFSMGDEVIQVVSLEMNDVVRQAVFHVLVVFPTAADEDDGKAQFREGTDDLVDPARHPAADIGKGSFEKQRDVGLASLRESHVRLQ